MFLVTVEIMIAAVIVVAGVWWQYYGRFPDLRTIWMVAIKDPLEVSLRMSTGLGTCVMVRGKRFLYRYDQKNGSATIILFVLTHRKKILLTARIENDMVLDWKVEGKWNEKPATYPEQFEILGILRAVKNEIDSNHASEATVAAFLEGRG
jgi:hypothetical protein